MMNKLLLIVIVFLLLGSFMIITAYQLKLEDRGDRTSFLRIFGRWVLHLGANVKQLTGLVIQQDWLPHSTETNQTNATVEVVKKG